MQSTSLELRERDPPPKVSPFSTASPQLGRRPSKDPSLQRRTGIALKTCPFHSAETPEVELKAQERDGFKTLFCRAYGFEPVMIRMAWEKDGRDWQAHTFRGIVAPNVDGTYYFWISVRVGPEEEGRYVCRVEHASLAEPLERTWEESGER